MPELITDLGQCIKCNTVFHTIAIRPNAGNLKAQCRYSLMLLPGGDMFRAVVI
jgi:hypothetical protein